MALDTSSLLPGLFLCFATALLVLLAAAEAAAIEIARRRVRGGAYPGLAALLRAYVAERRRLLRSVRAGITAAIVIAVAAAGALQVEHGGRRLALVALVVFALVSVVRTAARRIAQSHPEAVARRLDRPVRQIQFLLTPVTALLTLLVALPLRALGQRAPGDEMDPAEELIGLLEATDDQDAALLEQRRMMRGVLELSGRTVRELMTPRTDVTAISLEASFGDVMKVVSDSGFSRIPLYDGSLDHVVGVVYAKDLLAYVSNGNVTPGLRELARPPYVVPETKRADELLAELRRDKVHMAIAVDEYGGTAGVITVEDLIEEIVGEITDEYDTVGVEVQSLSPDEAIVDGSLTIDELNELFETEIVPEDFDTVGGLIVTVLGRLALPGDDVLVPHLEDGEDERVTQLELKVLTILGRRIKQVSVQRRQPASAPSAARAEAL